MYMASVAATWQEQFKLVDHTDTLFTCYMTIGDMLDNRRC